jgi:hypothetical protein
VLFHVAARNKTVVFRITPDEYQNLKSACSEHGARSLSDYARARVLSAADESTLAGIGRKLNELEHAVQVLTDTLQASVEFPQPAVEEAWQSTSHATAR